MRHVCVLTNTCKSLYVLCVTHVSHTYNSEFDADLYHTCINVQMYLSVFISTYVCVYILTYVQTDKQMDRHSYLYTYTDGKNLITLFILILIRYAVILKCWKTDVDERLSFKDILEELNSLSNYL